VWLDIYQAGGGAIEEVSTGIINAKAILVLLSRQYKDSPLCRWVAEYVLALNKEVFFISADPHFKPDGWLKDIIGNAVIYNLCLDSFDTNIDAVLQELEMRERLKEAEANTPLILPWTVQPSNFQCWSVVQVVDWLENNGLASYQPFSEHDVNGITLKNLIQLGKQDIRGLSSILYHYFGIKSWKHQSRILSMFDKLM